MRYTKLGIFIISVIITVGILSNIISVKKQMEKIEIQMSISQKI